MTFVSLSAIGDVVQPLHPKGKEFLSYEIRAIAHRADVETTLSLRGDPQGLRPSQNCFPQGLLSLDLPQPSPGQSSRPTPGVSFCHWPLCSPCSEVNTPPPFKQQHLRAISGYGLRLVLRRTWEKGPGLTWVPVIPSPCFLPQHTLLLLPHSTSKRYCLSSADQEKSGSHKQEPRM